MTERLPALKSRDLIRALERAGFSVTRTSGSHSRLVHGTDPTRKVTVPVHAGKDLKRGTVQGILRQAGLTVEELNEPKWIAGTESRLMTDRRYATALANGGRGSEDLLLLEEATDGWVPIGCYVHEALVIAPRARGQGLSTELILRCSEHRPVPSRRKLSESGYAALSKAHRVAVQSAVREGRAVPTEVREYYSL